MRGKLVELRSWERADIPAYAEWLRNPNVSGLSHMARRPIPLREVEEEFEPYFASKGFSGKGPFYCAVVDRQEGRLVGNLRWEELLKGPDVYEIGVIVGDPELWRRGFGAEACYLGLRILFRELKAHKVMYQVSDYNRTNVELGKSIGFKEEGRIRDRFYVDGRYVDALWFGLLREDFEKIDRRFSSSVA